jgi:hypothetical protein
MWYPIADYSLDEARRFLLEDFSKVLRRTRYLYVETKPREDIGCGFFEPILLCSCWCDFLGALCAGDATIGNTKRIKSFVDNVLGEVNPRYRDASDRLVSVYRHGTVHAYAPAGSFNVTFDVDQHLTIDGAMLVISVQQLVDDMLAAVQLFARTLVNDVGSTAPGTLGAFNAARRQLG